MKQPQSLQTLLSDFGDKITRTEIVACTMCGVAVESPFIRLAGNEYPIYTECADHRYSNTYGATAQYENPRIYRNEETWSKICPQAYRDTDASRIPASLKEKLSTWQYGARGLILSGATGTYKTRGIYTLLKRMYLDGLKTIRVFDGMKFASEMQKAFMSNDSDIWLDKLTEVDCLYFDDLNQFVFTDRAEQCLYQILETRMQKGVPLFFSTNLAGTELLERFSPSRGRAIIRRIGEACEVIAT